MKYIMHINITLQNYFLAAVEGFFNQPGAQNPSDMNLFRVNHHSIKSDVTQWTFWELITIQSKQWGVKGLERWVYLKYLKLIFKPWFDFQFNNFLPKTLYLSVKEDKFSPRIVYESNRKGDI